VEFSGDLLELLCQYLRSGLYIRTGDRFTVCSKGSEVEFKVVEMLPEGLESGFISHGTLVHFQGTPLQRTDE
jgi:hypothetical protein